MRGLTEKNTHTPHTAVTRREKEEKEATEWLTQHNKTFKYVMMHIYYGSGTSTSYVPFKRKLASGGILMKWFIYWIP